MRSLQTDITYGANPENLDSMESKSLEKQCFILQVMVVET